MKYLKVDTQLILYLKVDSDLVYLSHCHPNTRLRTLEFFEVAIKSEIQYKFDGINLRAMGLTWGTSSSTFQCIK